MKDTAGGRSRALQHARRDDHAAARKAAPNHRFGRMGPLALRGGRPGRQTRRQGARRPAWLPTTTPDRTRERRPVEPASALMSAALFDRFPVHRRRWARSSPNACDGAGHMLAFEAALARAQAAEGVIPSAAAAAPIGAACQVGRASTSMRTGRGRVRWPARWSFRSSGSSLPRSPPLDQGRRGQRALGHARARTCWTLRWCLPLGVRSRSSMPTLGELIACRGRARRGARRRRPCWGAPCFSRRW